MREKNSHTKVGSKWYSRHPTFQSSVLMEGLGTSQLPFLTNIWPAFSSTAPEEESRALLKDLFPFYVTFYQPPTWISFFHITLMCYCSVPSIKGEQLAATLCTKPVANWGTVTLFSFLYIKHNTSFNLHSMLPKLSLELPPIHPHPY